MSNNYPEYKYIIFYNVSCENMPQLLHVLHVAVYMQRQLTSFTFTTLTS